MGQTNSRQQGKNNSLGETKTTSLLAADDPPAVEIRHGSAACPFVILVDHAGRAIPRRLGRLGLGEADLARHIAWDIGAGATAALLAARLDAPLVAQAYSRLVIDCNRRPGHPTSVAEVSDLTAVPGNQALDAAQRGAREREIFDPYHARIAGLLDERRDAGLPSVLVALHSFTPRLADPARPSAGGAGLRPWHIGLLYNRDARLARILFDLLGGEAGLVVGDNEPYQLSDLDDYTVPLHGEARGLPHVEIELRQDLIEGPAGQAEWAERLARLLGAAWPRLAGTAPGSAPG